MITMDVNVYLLCLGIRRIPGVGVSRMYHLDVKLGSIVSDVRIGDGVI